MKRWLCSIIIILSTFGCITSVDEQGRKTYSIDPNTSARVEQSVEGTAVLLNALSPYLPYAGTAGAALLAALGIYRKKVKPNFEQAKTEANTYHTATHTLVSVIEEIKKNQPEIWKQIKPYLESQMGQNIENVIRALRGLPPKE